MGDTFQFSILCLWDTENVLRQNFTPDFVHPRSTSSPQSHICRKLHFSYTCSTHYKLRWIQDGEQAVQTQKQGQKQRIPLTV